MSIAALVLAAGAGRRFGGPKALFRPDPDGLCLVEEAVCRAADAGLGTIAVVVGAESDSVTEVLMSGGWALHRRRDRRRRRVDVLIVDADDWEEGMGASLRAGLDALTDLRAEALQASEGEPAIDAALVTLVDLPDVTSQVHRRILTRGRRRGATALVRAAYRAVPGHPVLIGSDHWAAVRENAIGDRGARDFFRAHPPELVECSDLATGADVDTRGDLTQG